MKKSNQKSLGENPETPDAPVRLPGGGLLFYEEK